MNPTGPPVPSKQINNTIIVIIKRHISDDVLFMCELVKNYSIFHSYKKIK